MEIEGVSLEALKALPTEELEELLAFGRPITFRMGTATVLAEFNRDREELAVNLAHIDGGGEGVVASLWKLIERYAKERGYTSIVWNVHALTCANPNPRLQHFLRDRGFEEENSKTYGRVLVLRRKL
ncbi:MAG: hypothetical protein ACREB7_16720 [Sphingopyxis sp.]|uniref:hypothetical protein n=1 Tax=Sphingopyxis sp. TaxID=1908224 RepID=UPI003D6CC1D1